MRRAVRFRPATAACFGLLGLLHASAVHADALSEPPTHWKGRLAEVAELDLAGMDATGREEVRRARAEITELLRRPGINEVALGDAYGRLGALYHVHEVPSAAERCYLNATRHAPGNFRWHYYLGELLREGGRYREALAAYHRAGEVDPDYPPLALRQAQALIEEGRLEQAEGLLGTVVDSPGLEAATAYELARIAQMRREHGKTVDYLLQALERDPGADRLHYPLAQALRALGRHDEARGHLARQGKGLPRPEDPLLQAMQNLKRGAHSHFRRAMEAVESAEYREAVKAFRQGLAMDRDNMHARVSYARALFLSGHRGAAQDQLEKVLMEKPDTELAAFLLGILVDQAGDAERAEALYEVVLRTRPEHAGARFYLGCQQFRIGNYRSAAKHLGIAFQANPDIGLAGLLQLLAKWYAGEADVAILPPLQALIDARPQDPQPRYAMALLRAASQDERVRDAGQALELARALAREVPMPPTLALLARAHAASGEHDEAERLFQQLQGLPFWDQGVAAGELRADLQVFRQGLLPATMWRAHDLMLQAPPPMADGPMREYPAVVPY